MCGPALLLALTHVVGTLSPSPEWTSDYPQAFKQAEALNKPLAVFIGSGAAGWNAASTQGELDNQARRLLNEKYVCLYIDASSPEGKKVADSFEARNLPTVVISDRARAYQAYRRAGSLSPSQLTSVLQRYSGAAEVPVRVTYPSSRIVIPCST